MISTRARPRSCPSSIPTPSSWSASIATPPAATCSRCPPASSTPARRPRPAPRARPRRRPATAPAGSRSSARSSPRPASPTSSSICTPGSTSSRPGPRSRPTRISPSYDAVRRGARRASSAARSPTPRRCGRCCSPPARANGAALSRAARPAPSSSGWCRRRLGALAHLFAGDHPTLASVIRDVAEPRAASSSGCSSCWSSPSCSRRCRSGIVGAGDRGGWGGSAS